jgi:uncharacterized membrane protein
MRVYLFIFSFIFIHIFLGRKISIPYGVALGINPYMVGVEAFLLDVIQIPFFYHLYEHSTRISIVASLKRWSDERQRNLEKSRLFTLAKKSGKLGIIIISASPLQGGGMWSGVLMTFLLNFPKRESYILNILGSILGCAILVVGTNILLNWLRSLV